MTARVSEMGAALTVAGGGADEAAFLAGPLSLLEQPAANISTQAASSAPANCAFFMDRPKWLDRTG